MMRFEPISLQRMNSSIALKKNHDRGSQSILVCLRCSDYLEQQKSSYDLFLSKSIHLGVFFTASTYSAATGVKPKKPRKPLHQMAGFKLGIWDAGLIKLI